MHADWHHGPEGGSPPPSQEDCAKEGIAYLLDKLLPCESTTSCGTADANSENVPNAVDRVGLMVFPALCGTSGAGTTCNSTIPTASTGVPDETGCSSANYNAIAGGSTPNDTYDYSTAHFITNTTGWYTNYQAVPFESDYRSNGSTITLADANNPWAALNPSSSLTKAIWWGTSSAPNCTGGTYPGYGNGDEQYGVEDPGGRGTYYGDVFLQAENTFASAGRSNAHDAIIFLSDGDATSSAGDLKYSQNDPTGKNECQAGINAAMQAEGPPHNILVFTIAYGANNNGCSTDTFNCSSPSNETDCAYSPICAMDLMADNPVTNPSFTSLYAAEQALCGAKSTYPTNTTYRFFNTPTGSDFQLAFGTVGAELTASRLVPDGAT